MSDFTTRPEIMARRYVVTSGHYLATAAGVHIMERGGNAIDAAAAMCICLNLLEPYSNGIGGEAPTLIYSAAEGKPFAISGMGCSPAALTIDYCREHGIDLIPGDGYLPACVPATLDTWACAVARFGRLRFADILAPAIELAEEGFPVYPAFSRSTEDKAKLFLERYPSTAAIYCPGGRIPRVGERFRNPDFAATLRTMVAAEEASGGGRERGIEAARDAFYRGPIAERIVRFIADPLLDASGEEHAGLLTMDDMAAWRAAAETPCSVDFRGVEVHKCGPWTQGPVFLQQLRLLDGFDLQGMGHNSADYLHAVIECAKLAFADREAYYGDPEHDQVPLDRLLSAGYADDRRKTIGDDASGELVAGPLGAEGLPLADVLADNRAALGPIANGRAGREAGEGAGHAHMGDTTHCDAIDADGNMVACTPSGGWIGSSPVVPGLGFPIGTRAQMFYLNPNRANAAAGRKRPRATLTPSLVTREGRPEMVFGTPGGDGQDQWTLQVFLNHRVFGMPLQQALEAPTVHSTHFPSSFYPRRAYQRGVSAESRIDAGVLDELRRRGHEVRMTGPWGHGKPMAVRIDAEQGVIRGGVSPRGVIGYALGW